MRAFCPQCKAKVSVVMVLANVARRELAENKRVKVIHVTPRVTITYGWSKKTISRKSRRRQCPNYPILLMMRS
jgi:hypothetical protein